MIPFSVIIPTYKEPEALNLCLFSAIKGKTKPNQIIVVVDGFYDINKHVLDKYKNEIEIVNLPENVGLSRAINFGVLHAKHEYVLIVNDDNVFPYDWDLNLQHVLGPNNVVSPNQIEPNPSMFNQFHIKNMGELDVFDVYKFWKYEQTISSQTFDTTGSTFPILISKINYLRVGGFDPEYPGAWVVDWDFFLKCKMAGMDMIRTYNAHFYHFVSIGTKSPERIAASTLKERECWIYSQNKWGKTIKHNPINNDKYL